MKRRNLSIDDDIFLYLVITSASCARGVRQIELQVAGPRVGDCPSVTASTKDSNLTRNLAVW